MADYIADVFMTLDGFGTGTEGYWGKAGPELVAQRAAVFADREQTLVFGRRSFEITRRFAKLGADPNLEPLDGMNKVVFSRSLQDADWVNTTVVAEDATKALGAMKAESPVPLRGHGSLSMNRALLAAGLVDRLEVTLFPIINGATGSNPVFAELPDIDLELLEAELFDGRVQRLVYHPTVRA